MILLMQSEGTSIGSTNDSILTVLHDRRKLHFAVPHPTPAQFMGSDHGLGSQLNLRAGSNVFDRRATPALGSARDPQHFSTRSRLVALPAAPPERHENRWQGSTNSQTVRRIRRQFSHQTLMCFAHMVVGHRRKEVMQRVETTTDRSP